MNDQSEDKLGRHAHERRNAAEFEPHPSADAIAQLIEGGEPPADEGVAAHVVDCRRCFALYAEMVHTEYGLRSGGESIVPAEFLRQALEIASGASPGQQPRVRRSSLVAIGEAALAGLVLLAVLDAPRQSRRLDPDLVAIVDASTWAGLPDGWIIDERPPPAPGRVFRSGISAGDRELSAAIDALVDRYDNPKLCSAALADLLVRACLAEPDFESATEFLRDARAQFPGSRRLTLLQAALEYRLSRTEQAISTLRGLVDGDPRDTVARVDLAILLDTEGRNDEAIAILQQLQRSRPPDDALVAHLASRLAAAQP